MFAIAVAGFAFSFIGLCALFALKYVEMQKSVVYFPEWRMEADRRARMAKATMRYLAMRLEQLPHDFILFLRMAVHVGAMLFARGARAAEQAAHQVADRVSHKHHFERGETHSEFLKSVSAHKQGLERRRQ